MAVYYDDNMNVPTAIPTFNAPNRQLKTYFVMFSVHRNREWTCHAGYIFAYDEESIKSWLDKKYGDTIIRHVIEVDVEEGTILYGERWCKL